ncbi:MAG: polysaccharide export protein [Deltaproteobacteria bacterium]|nr:polysaccharide export protein [Deltaproteobacteria bacterium]
MPHIISNNTAVLLVFLVMFSFYGCTPEPTVANKQGDDKYTEKAVKITEITLGPEDEVEIKVWRNEDLNGIYKISSSGRLYIPLVGMIEASGKSAFELRQGIVDELSKYIVDPQVIIKVVSYESRKIYILGEVERPGVFQMESSMDLFGALAKAGGFTDDANDKKVFLIRGGLQSGDVKVFNMKAYLEKADMSQNKLLERGDIVYVPSSFIADVDKFFKHLEIILSPIVTAERAIILEPIAEDVLRGENPKNSVVVPK